MSYSLEQIAAALDLPCIGDAAHEVDSVAPIHTARKNQLSFVVGRKYAAELAKSDAGIVILPADLEADHNGNRIVAADPYLSYAKATHLLYPDDIPPAGAHASAVVDVAAQVHPTASIGAGAVIEAGVSIGEHCVIGAGCFIGHDTLIGARSRLFAHVTIYHGCTLGAHCRVQSGTVIGGEGFGYARGPEGWQRINQVGGVVIGDRVEIGANTAIDRGAIGDTVIEEGVILDNLIQIAHNVRIGRNTAIAACTGIAGSANVGSECTIGGSVNINGHIHIVDKVHITATSFVIRSITEPGQYSSGMLLEKNSKWRRTAARLTQLDAMASKLRRL